MSRSTVKTTIIVFFRQPWDCTQGICTSRTDSKSRLFTKMSWNYFENGSSQSERTLQTIGCCTTITYQLTLRLKFRNFYPKKNFFSVLPHPPYSPDLAPCDFYLFLTLKLKLKGQHVRIIEKILKTVTDELHSRKMTASTTMNKGRNVGIAM